MRHRHRFLFALCGLWAVCMPSAGRAGSATDRVRGMLEEVMTIQTDAALQGPGSRRARRTRIQEVIQDSFDSDAMAEHALEGRWETLDEAARAEFREIFRELFAESYTRLVLDFLGREDIRYGTEKSLDGRSVVATTIERPNEHIAVDYWLAPTSDNWVVDDVVIDGVSIVGNYRKSFSRVIGRSSFEALLEKMRLQRQTLDGGSDTR